MTEEAPIICATVRNDTDRLKLIAYLFLVWSNFEIGDLDFWRGEAYSKYFEYLESKGGFYYEVCTLFPSYSAECALIRRPALGRRPCAQYRRFPFRQEGSDTFLQRNRIPP
jgi:Glycolipid 2-alpha-mannosyltransferase